MSLKTDKNKDVTLTISQCTRTDAFIYNMHTR